MSLVKTYTYNNESYASEEDVRKAIWENEHKIFSVAPPENLTEFWAAIGVGYEEAEQVESLESQKAEKLAQLKTAFLKWRNSTATMHSSLGFTVDADSRAMQDITGLWVMVNNDSDFSATFMDAENVTHTLAAEDILTLAKEVVQAGTDAYREKWGLREQIESCETTEELDAISLEFTEPDYSKG